MLKNFSKRPLKQQYYLGIGLCIVIFFIGYYILNYVSTREIVPIKEIFGNTFYILIGSILIATSCCGILILINKIQNIDNFSVNNDLILLTTNFRRDRYHPFKGCYPCELNCRVVGSLISERL